MNNKMYLKIFLLTVVFSLFSSTYVLANTEGIVTGDRVNVRSGPSTSSTILDKYNTGYKIAIVSKEGDWYKITLANNQTAFIFGEFVKPADTTAVGITETPKIEPTENTSSTALRAELVTYAKQFIGNPYRYGGTSLTNGADCSGFTQSIYKNFGYSINRSSYTQYNNGQAVKSSELLPGDLVFFGYSGSISHVGIYIGDGQIIHASTSSTGIIISGLYDKGNKPYIGSRRIIS
ncbi:MAG: hypothetical protein CVV02_02425 [Firmicutes bacterium HGW-Firmicutes-7]|nr:MAG: hypothetical protein CVV02_02425 [Firmicutes bacterium HGW-Firmicutes-7]